MRVLGVCNITSCVVRNYDNEKLNWVVDFYITIFNHFLIIIINIICTVLDQIHHCRTIYCFWVKISNFFPPSYGPKLKELMLAKLTHTVSIRVFPALTLDIFSACTLTSMATCSALSVLGWCTHTSVKHWKLLTLNSPHLGYITEGERPPTHFQPVRGGHVVDATYTSITQFFLSSYAKCVMACMSPI